MSNIHPIDSDISNIIKNNLKILKGTEKLEVLLKILKKDMVIIVIMILF